MRGLARDRTIAYFAGDTAYTLTALVLAGAFYLFNGFPIRLNGIRYLAPLAYRKLP